MPTARILELDDELAVAELVSQAQGGDELAFAALYVYFFHRVYRYLRMRLGDSEDAQDLAQDVFERLIRALPNYDPKRGSFRAWIFSIARNLAIDNGRGRGRVLALAPKTLEAVSDRAATVTGRVDAGIGLGSLIDGLPDAQRRVLVLRFAYELRFADIADVVGSTPVAVRQLQQRALRTLAATLKPGSVAA